MTLQELLIDETKWIQGNWARNSKGARINCMSPDAACWCLAGALRRCYHATDSKDDSVLRQIWNRVDATLTDLGCDAIAWNDTPSRTFADIRHLIETLDI